MIHSKQAAALSYKGSEVLYGGSVYSPSKPTIHGTFVQESDGKTYIVSNAVVPPDAVDAASTLLANQAAEWVKKQGEFKGQEIKMIGFDELQKTYDEIMSKYSALDPPSSHYFLAPDPPATGELKAFEDDEYSEEWTPECLERLIAKKKREGFEVIESSNTLLLLDLDAGPLPRQTYDDMLPVVQRLFPGVVEKERWTSKDGEGLHVVLHCPLALTLEQRLVIQACLGSDLKKELLSLHDYVIGKIPNPVVLFKPKPKEHRTAPYTDEELESTLALSLEEFLDT